MAMSTEAMVEQQLTQSEAVEVLTELYTLMGGYAPAWYPEELQDQAEAALRVLRDLTYRA
jgi:hypothetical protein